jgi:hypothetical protein
MYSGKIAVPPGGGGIVKLLHLTQSSRLWTFHILGFEVFQVRLQKEASSTISVEVIEIHKGPREDKII